MMASLGAISSSHSPLMKNSKVFLIAMYLFSPQDFPLISPNYPVFSPGFGFSKALYSTSSPSTRTALDYALGKLICTMIPAFLSGISSFHLIFFGGVPVMKTSYFIGLSSTTGPA